MAERIFREMLDEKIQPDRVIYMTLRNAYAKAGMTNDAKRITIEMQQQTTSRR
jgi:transposase-like protein